MSVLDWVDVEHIPLYCINLESSTDRRARVTRRFEALGLLDRVRFVPAVDLDSPVVHGHLERFGQPKVGKRRRLELAVLYSHRLALELYLEEQPDANSLIVFEDDVMLDRNFQARLRSIFANLPADAAVCALGYLAFSRVSASWIGLDPSQRNLVPMNMKANWGNFGCWMSRAHAEQALRDFDDYARRPDVVAEHLLWRPEGFLAQPPLVIEEGIGSTVGRHDEELAERIPAFKAWGAQNYITVEEDSRLMGMDPDAPPQTICLCMIVRNEAAVIGRLAESVRGIIDSWIICDTGSTDGTPEKVREAFAGIPGEVCFDEWVDYGTNRSLMLERARGRADYLLILDADHTLAVRGELPHLEADAYSLLVDEAAAHWVPRLVRGDLPWRYVGAAHEYLTCDTAVQTEILPLLVVCHHADGGNRVDKLERERALLERDLAADPTNSRTLFYLAQTYNALGEDKLAIEFYERRIRCGGWSEEMFYAMYQYAELVSKTNWDLGVVLLMEAWEYRPTRAEPLYALMRGLRLRNHFHLAAMVGDRARTIPFPPRRRALRPPVPPRVGDRL